MKNWKYKIRLIGILSIGILLLKMTYYFKYSTFIFDLVIFGTLTVIGLIFLIWSLSTDIKQFRINKKISFLFPVGLGIVFTTILFIWNLQINRTFDKPTLIRIYYDGDFNGTGIDFKTDGTYIFDNSTIGCSEYKYGTFEINGNLITLDKYEFDNVIKTNKLKILHKKIEYPNRIETVKYVYQVSDDGTIMLNDTEFRLVVDNRNI